MNIIRRVWGRPAAPIKKEDDDETSSSSDSHEENGQSSTSFSSGPYQLSHQSSDEEIRKLCEDKSISNDGTKYEMIGRLLDYFKTSHLTHEEFDQFTQEELYEMVQARGLHIDGEVQRKEDLIDPLLSSLQPESVSPSSSSKRVSRVKSEKISKKKRRFEEDESGGGGKQYDDEDERPSLKKRKVECRLNSHQFINHAQPVGIRIGTQTYNLDPKKFSTGSFGWHSTGRQEVEVDGKTVMVAWNLNMTVIGSKPK